MAGRSGREPDDRASDGGMVPVVVFDDAGQAALYSLVLAAAGISHQLLRAGGDWRLLVKEKELPAAREELRLFAEENRNWPPESPAFAAAPDLPAGSPVVLPIVGALVVFYAVTGGWDSQGIWFARGALERSMVIGLGQWWRLVTSLTLHADSAHLLGNVFFGGLLAQALCRHLGSGLAWGAVLLAGVLANGVNVFFHDDLYRSVGFSTAVFGMVGILSGMRLRRVGGRQEMLLALGSAASLLAFMGSSGEQTDLGAHFWGLAFGLLIGVILAATGFAGKRVLSTSRQWLLLAATLSVVFVCWFYALYFVDTVL